MFNLCFIRGCSLRILTHVTVCLLVFLVAMNCDLGERCTLRVADGIRTFDLRSYITHLTLETSRKMAAILWRKKGYGSVVLFSSAFFRGLRALRDLMPSPWPRIVVAKRFRIAIMVFARW